MMNNDKNKKSKSLTLTAPEGLSTAKYIISGAVAGFCEVVCMYPLDVVKTRMQLQGQQGKVLYKNMFHCLYSIFKQEGVLKLYRGIISPIFAEAPKRAVKFTTNETYKEWIVRYKLDGDSKKLNKYHHAFCGAMAGSTEAFVNCPFEVVKVRMQAKENSAMFNNTGDALIKTIRNEGFFSLYRGIEPLVWRNAIWNGLYFAFIPIVSSYLPKGDTTGQVTLYKFISGSVASTIATCANTPFDMVKSRMQNVGSSSKYVLPTLVKVYREEGFRKLYRGLGPRIARLAPGGGIMIVAFDYVAAILKDWNF